MTIQKVAREERIPAISATPEENELVRYAVDQNRALREWYREYREVVNRAVNLPSFRVHRNASNQASVVTATATKVQFNSVGTSASAEGYDDFAYFDLTTNYRYTPKIAGVYLFTLQVAFTVITAGAYTDAIIYRNGGSGLVVAGQRSLAQGTDPPVVCATGMCRMNGSTDYVEAFAAHNTGADKIINGAVGITFFAGAKIADY